MKRERRPSLVRRLSLAMSLFGVFVAFVFTASTIAIFFWTEDAVLSRTTELAADRALDSSTKGAERLVVHQAEKMPPSVLRLVDQHGLGTHEVELDGREQFLVVRKAPNGKLLAVTYDVTGLEPNDGAFGIWVVLLCVGIGLVIAIATTLIGRAIVARITAPLRDLVETVEGSGTERLSTRLRTKQRSREVQALVDSLSTSIETIEAFRDREERFTRYASHELRTPVASIRGASELLRAGSDRPERLLDRIDRGVDSMHGLIDTFLWLARAPEPSDAEPMEVGGAIERVVSIHARSASLRGVELEVAVDASATVFAPKAVLGVAIGNLLANAIAFSESGGKVIVHADDSHIDVVDHGPGMDPEELEASLREFQRNQASPGYGLGLPIVLAICDRMGWQLDIDSDIGEGTRARISFESNEPVA